MKKIRRIFIFALFYLGIYIIGSLLQPMTARASFDPNNLIDDPHFNNTVSMSPAQIDVFLNSQPNSCISPNANSNGNPGFRTQDPQGWSPSQNDYVFGGSVTAGQAIYDAAQNYHLNPQVILTDLQKEQSLVSGSAGCYYNSPDPASATPNNDGRCGSTQYHPTCTIACPYSGGCVNIAMGYDCPNYCYAGMEGFSRQIIGAAWALRWAQERSYGVLTGYPGYDPGDENIGYSGPMTPGNRQRVAGGPTNYYDGTYTTSNGVGVTITTGATASLYSYTPFTTGNQNFVNIYENWFGATRGGYCITSQTSVQTGVQFQQYIAHKATPDFLIYSGSGSGCVESHIWAPGFTSWQAHIASQLQSITVPNAQILYGDLDGSGQDYPVLFGLNNYNPAGKVEAWIWSHNMQTFIAHTYSNLPAINTTDNKVALADYNGDKKADSIFIKMQNTGSGYVELHGWAPGMQSFAFDTITNLPAINPADGTIVYGDPYGWGHDEAIYVHYRNTGSHMLEIHIWNPGEWSWNSHTATNLPEVNPADGEVQFADINGDGHDEAIYIKYRNTGSGYVEFHVWNPGFTSWQSHIISNQPEIQ